MEIKGCITVETYNFQLVPTPRRNATHPLQFQSSGYRVAVLNGMCGKACKNHKSCVQNHSKIFAVRNLKGITGCKGERIFAAMCNQLYIIGKGIEVKFVHYTTYLWVVTARMGV